MPTGYTADVEDGKVTDFRTFALRCARAFGATIMQRENAMDELPKHREPSDFYAKELQKARAEIKRLATFTIEQANDAADAEFIKATKEYDRSVATLAIENARYKAMLQKVRAWHPPTADHRGLKKFMIEQLEISMHDWTPTPPLRKLGDQWLREKQEQARENVARYAAEHEKEIARCTEANAWIDTLYESLNETAGVV